MISAKRLRMDGAVQKLIGIVERSVDSGNNHIFSKLPLSDVPRISTGVRIFSNTDLK